MRATRKPNRPGERRRESKGVRRAFAVSMIVIFAVFGVGLPALAVISDSNAEDQVRGGVDLTTAQAHGRELFTHNCATCHTLAASNAVGLVGPNLDKLRPNEALVLNAIQQGRARGQGQMPANLVTAQDAKDVASYVSSVAGR
jgi:mono/diheme cytochrome c family protein